MGKKEQQKKSKRNLALQTYLAKRPAARSGNPASRILEIWHSDSESVSSGGVETERELARAPPPNPAAGSGNPASSVSSGGVEAEWKLVEPEVKVIIPTCEGGDSKATAVADSWQLYPAETTAVSATEPSMPAVLPHAF